MVGASGFEPPTSWSRTKKSKILSRFGGVTYGPKPPFFEPLIEPNLNLSAGVNPLDGTNYLDTVSAFIKAFLASSTSSLEGMNTSAKLIFLCGKMAAGKSTLARHLAKRENASR